MDSALHKGKDYTAISPTILDLYRFSGTLESFDFHSTPRILAPARTFHVLRDPDNFAELMSQGIHDGDGNQASHWKADEECGRYIGIMDPTLGTNQHSGLSPSDEEAFRLLGWRINGRCSAIISFVHII